MLHGAFVFVWVVDTCPCGVCHVWTMYMYITCGLWICMHVWAIDWCVCVDCEMCVRAVTMCAYVGCCMCGLCTCVHMWSVDTCVVGAVNTCGLWR